MTDKPSTAPPSAPIVVFGLDKDRKPRAGTFPADQADAAASRARALNFVCKPIEGPTITALARDLKAGDLTKEGAEFIPSVIRAAYERLLTGTGVVGSKAPTQERRAPNEARKVEEAAKGRLAALPPPRTPPSWKDLEVGDLVLAEDATPGEGWFEARLVEKAGTEQFKIIFIDYPEEGEHLRRRDQLALLPPPASAPKPAAK